MYDMIDIVEIIISNGVFNKINAIISFEHNYCFYNNHKYNIDNEFKDNFTRIVRSWNHEYGSSRDLDAEEFNIIITTTDKKKEVFHGKGIFPRGYSSLIKMFGDLDG